MHIHNNNHTLTFYRIEECMFRCFQHYMQAKPKPASIVIVSTKFFWEKGNLASSGFIYFFWNCVGYDTKSDCKKFVSAWPWVARIYFNSFVINLYYKFHESLVFCSKKYKISEKHTLRFSVRSTTLLNSHHAFNHRSVMRVTISHPIIQFNVKSACGGECC